MKFRCPGCGREYDWREAIKDRDLLEIIRIQADFVPHSRLVMEYAELFETTRPIKAKKLFRILTELKDVYASGEFGFQKTRYRISRNGIAEALKVVCNKRFTVPLEKHNYLKKVMISIAEEEAKKRSIEAEKELMEKEARLRAGSRPYLPSPQPSPAGGEGGRSTKSVPWRKE